MSHRIMSVSRIVCDNVGDMSSVPWKYFNDLDGEHESIDHLDTNRLTGKFVIVGGGGLVDHMPAWSETLRVIGRKAFVAIAWGMGTNNERGMCPNYSSLCGYKLVGCRDWGSPFDWVPCVSCMSPLMDKYRAVEPCHDMVIYHHIHRKFEISGVPAIDNGRGLEDVLSFLASGDVVLTNTYHGMYWATLLGRKVVVASPFSTRFYFSKYRHVVSSFDDLMALRKIAVRYPEALEECRSANLSFVCKVHRLLGESGNGRQS